MSSHRFGKSLAIGIAAVIVVGGGAVAVVGPENLHEKIFGEDEHESVSAFAREHHGINMHSQAVATVMEKLEGGGEESLGPNQMRYDDNAFPRSAIAAPQVKHAFDAFAAADARKGKPGTGSWQPIPNDEGTVPGPVTYTGNPSHVSGRTTAIAVAPDGRTVYLGTAGGGVWKTTDITAAKPVWNPIGDSIPSQAIGSLTLSHGTLYVGTGEANGSSDNEAGMGLFTSTDGGDLHRDGRVPPVLQGPQYLLDRRRPDRPAAPPGRHDARPARLVVGERWPDDTSWSGSARPL